MQKYGLFSTGIDTRSPSPSVSMLPMKTDDRQGYYRASDVDAEREKDRLRIQELEQALTKARNCIASIKCTCSNLGDGELMHCHRCDVLATTRLMDK